MTEENMEIQKTDLEIAIEVLAPMVENGESEDDMGVALVGAGFKFAKAGRLVIQALESMGHRKSSKERYAEAESLLNSWAFSPDSWDDVDGAAENLEEQIDATSKAQAISCIKKFCKAMEIELPAKPKGTGTPRNSSDAQFYEWALAHRDATADDVESFVIGLGVTEKQVGKYVAAYVPRLEFARKFASQA